jgi:hypothetical protein
MSAVHESSTALDHQRRMRDIVRWIQETQDLDELWQRIREFRALLHQRFATEEAPGGFYDDVRAAAPCRPVAIQALRDEHATLLANADGVALRIRACLETTVAELVDDAHRLVRGVRDHEARENAVLMDIVYTDLGHGDA